MQSSLSCPTLINLEEVNGHKHWGVENKPLFCFLKCLIWPRHTLLNEVDHFPFPRLSTFPLRPFRWQLVGLPYKYIPSAKFFIHSFFIHSTKKSHHLSIFTKSSKQVLSLFLFLFSVSAYWYVYMLMTCWSLGQTWS